MKYIFFDLDETLIDIKTAQNKAAEKFFYEYNFDKITTINQFIKKWDELTEYHYAFYTKKSISYTEQRKRRMEDLFKYYGIKTQKSGVELYNEYLKIFEQNWCLFKDVLPALNYLKDKGLILGIISNGDLNQQIQKCKNTNIFDYFTYINASSEFPISKPNPLLFETIFKSHDINTTEVLYVGDSYEKDIIPCESLKIKCLLIDRNNKHKDIHTECKISNLEDIKNFI